MQTLSTNKTINLQELVAISVVSDLDTPVSIFEKLSRDSQNAFLLESTEGDSRLARFSFIGVEPSLTVSFKSGTVLVQQLTSGGVRQRPDTSENAGVAYETIEEKRFADPTLILQEVLDHYGPQATEDIAGIPFTGGLVGYMSYAATQYFEQIEQQSDDPFNLPEGFYGLYDTIVAFDHQYRTVTILSRRGEQYAQSLLKRMQEPNHLTPMPAPRLAHETNDQVFANVETRLSRTEFLTKVDQCKQLVQCGEVFQIVLSQRFSVAANAEPLNIYRALQALNPSPYAYFLKAPGFSYIGSSPETFAKCNDGKVSLRAIAGTRPRGKTEEEDQRLQDELYASEKELAEHHMLVDLGRNDIGRVSEVGSVEVGQIAELMRFTHVMHLGTEVSGKLAADKSAFDAFRGCFPRGTVSGAPKVRAMQHLAKLEPERRGIYSGVVGYFDFKGNMDSAIAIRSALIKDGKAHVNAGAGIVLDSDPVGEYEETRSKAKSVIRAIQFANSLRSAGVSPHRKRPRSAGVSPAPQLKV